jgi:hypothetical protein
VARADGMTRLFISSDDAGELLVTKVDIMVTTVFAHEPIEPERKNLTTWPVAFIYRASEFR